MISLSTSWNARAGISGREMIAEIISAGFDTVELGFSLTQQMVDDVLELHREGVVRVSSLHNMCPLPTEITTQKASPDHYSLSSTDAAERSLAVKAAMNTILWAARFGAKAVVLHAGRLPITDRTRELSSLAGDPVAFAALKREMVEERHAVGPKHRDMTLRSLAELVPFALDNGVAVGIENRYYFREIPVIDELSAIFGRFKPGEIFYWHDVGHAEVFDRLGLASHAELLRRFSTRLIGIHLHDIMGPMQDHRAPGAGTFDFGLVRPFINSSTILVMEVHQPATADDLRSGLAVLRKSLLG